MSPGIGPAGQCLLLDFAPGPARPRRGSAPEAPGARPAGDRRRRGRRMPGDAARASGVRGPTRLDARLHYPRTDYSSRRGRCPPTRMNRGIPPAARTHRSHLGSDWPAASRTFPPRTEPPGWITRERVPPGAKSRRRRWPQAVAGGHSHPGVPAPGAARTPRPPLSADQTASGFGKPAGRHRYGRRTRACGPREEGRKSGAPREMSAPTSAGCA